MSSYRDFWNGYKKGTKFGVRDNAHPNGHRGQDIVASAGTYTPALRSGTVVQIQYSTILGNTIVIKHGADDYDGYSHQKNISVRVGSKVKRGNHIAQIAGYGDLHGSAWLGPHLHFTNGAHLRSIFDAPVRNPLGIIKSAIASSYILGTAGTGTTTPVKPPTVKNKTRKDDMAKVYNDSDFKVKKSVTSYMRAWPNGVVDITTSVNHAEAWKADADQAHTEAISKERWDYYIACAKRRAAGIPSD